MSLLIGGGLTYEYAVRKVRTELDAAIAAGQRIVQNAVDDVEEAADPDLRLRLVLSDPILAAIEGHRRVFDGLLRLLAEQDTAERALRRAAKSKRPGLVARLEALCEAEGLLGQAEARAAHRLAQTVPASLTGAAATLRYVRERFAAGEYAMYDEDGYRMLLFSAECTICRAAGLPVPPRGG